jgi:cytoskeletal protein CcmA (bactofilin family)
LRPVCRSFASLPGHASRNGAGAGLTVRGFTAENTSISDNNPVHRARLTDRSDGAATPLTSWTVEAMTTIGPSLIITGDVTSQEDMTVHGKVNGQITMQQGTLVIAPTGSADANVQGITVTIHGKVGGDVAASERIELTQTAVVNGTITAPALVLQDGATFNGIIDMSVKKGATKSAAPASPKLSVVEPAAKAS